MPNPTPTQAENDLAAQGQHVADKEHDGSADDPNNQPPADPGAKKKEVHAEHQPTRGGYQTRQTTAHRPQPQPVPPVPPPTPSSE